MDNSLPTVATGFVGVTVGSGFEETLTFSEVLLFELSAVFTDGVVVVLPADRTEELLLLTDVPERAPLPVESAPAFDELMTTLLVVSPTTLAITYGIFRTLKK